MTYAARFEIDYVAYLDANGVVVKKPLPPIADDLEKLVALYGHMVRLRVFDTKAVALQRTGKLGTYASCLGHEAIHTAIGACMRSEDCFAPMYREYGAQFWRGVKMAEVLRYWGGDERGNDFSGPRHDFAWCVPIATQCLHAAGAALAYKTRGERRVAVSVVGDGGTSKGDFYGAVNVAGAYKLPLVLVIVNNQWAISVPRSAQTGAETLAQKAIAGGIRGIQIDGNDMLACMEVMSEAIERARDGHGATVVEAVTYRLSDHTTADDARRYRPKQEVDEAFEREPIARLKRYLVARGAWDQAQEDLLKLEAQAEVEAQVADYEQTPPPRIGDMFDYMYADTPRELIEQRTHALKFKPLTHGH